MRRSAMLPPTALAPAVNCSLLMASPIDASPIRSPQAVHSQIAARVKGRSIVEIGTRNGDGLACMAQVAASAVAIEASPPYCAKLRKRAATLPGSTSFSVVCSRYQKATMPVADVYTWWQQAPHLTDATLLAHLRRLQLDGRIGRAAVALIAFDQSWSVDRRSWRAIGKRATWAARVPYDERAACLARAGTSTKQQRLCAQRAHGTFILAEVPIAHDPAVTSTAATSTAATRTATSTATAAAPTGVPMGAPGRVLSDSGALRGRSSDRGAIDIGTSSSRLPARRASVPLPPSSFRVARNSYTLDNAYASWWSPLMEGGDGMATLGRAADVPRPSNSYLHAT